ncbi:hypothetical protein AJ80_05472 [Polytolypa hystricis UAMH7299]|uniref:BTB domain-containing protein n=1 Tax=Polytolypa hystricis (strain UAMH7299) TaxID=1447883 RepID=A0A2B7Y449_POLH7|nr:hypothetical protein AJ80_05472 [Polytolypa hystricis UAMH7299]
MTATDGSSLVVLMPCEGKYSDLTIICSPYKFPVHRIVVCRQSSFFAAICDGHFQKVTNQKSWKPTGVESSGGPVGLESAFKSARLYIIADKYGIQDLEKNAGEKFASCATKLFTQSDWERFPALVKEIYDNTLDSDETLRGPVTDIVVRDLDHVLGDQRLCNVLKTVPDLLLSALRQRNMLRLTPNWEPSENRIRMGGQALVSIPDSPDSPPPLKRLRTKHPHHN